MGNCTREESESTSRQQIHSFEPSCPVVAQPPGPSEIDRASFKMPEATATPRHEPEDPSEQTFKKMDDALEEKDLATLSSLGHFLKGSSATLGLTKVKDSCEKIQHYGQKKDDEGTEDEPDDDKCLERIKDTLVTVKEEYAEVEKVLKKFYGS